MGTPIRQLVLRGLSPNILRPQRSPVYLNVPSPTTSRNSAKANDFVKCLKFPNSLSSPNDKSYHEENDLGISVLAETKSFVGGLRNFSITLANVDSEANARVDCAKLIDSSEVVDSKQLTVPPNRELPFVNTPDREELLASGTFAKTNLNVLGKGSYGTVIQAIYKGQQVAVKIVSNQKPSGSLLRETNALRLHHPNVVKTIKVVCEPLAKYGIVVMDDCSDSRNMQHLLDDPTTCLSLHTIVMWLLNICEALKHCHEQAILHLDVKPKNILVHGNNQCRLCDFGSSLDMNCAGQRNYSHQGTVAYTAPELFQAKLPDCSADVYSLGITMWQMQSRCNPYKDVDNQDAVIYFVRLVSGIFVFIRNDYRQILKVVKHGMRPTISTTVTSAYQQLYTDCWAADPGLRPSLSNILHQLQDIRR